MVRAARRDADGRPARPALGGVGQVRAWCRSVRDRPGHRPVRRVAARDVSRSGGARGCHRHPGRGHAATRAVHGCADQPGQPDPRHGASSPTTSRPCSIRSGSRCPATATRVRVALPPWRPDSEAEIDVVEEVGPPLRLRADRQDGAQVDRARTAVADAAAGAVSCATCCSGSGSPRRCRIRSSLPTPWPRRVSTVRR